MKSYEMVESLSDKAHVSLEQAKEALEKSNWDMLDALIYLERNNNASIPNAGNNGFNYPGSQMNPINGQFGQPPMPPHGAPFPPHGAPMPPHGPQFGPRPNGFNAPPRGKGPNGPQFRVVPPNGVPPYDPGKSVSESLGRACGKAEKIIGNGFDNSFVIRKKDGEVLVQLPVFIFIIALLASVPIFPAVFILTIIGLFSVLRISFEGKNIENLSLNDTVNDAVKKATDATEKIKDDFKTGFDEAKK